MSDDLDLDRLLKEQEVKEGRDEKGRFVSPPRCPYCGANGKREHDATCQRHPSGGV